LYSSPTLLNAYPDGTGPFIKWLESLGLAEFLKIYPLSKLIEWGWVVPQYRVVFPPELFKQLFERRVEHLEVPPELKDYATLWEYTWITDTEDVKLWFLDGAFRDNEPLNTLLQQFRYDAGNPSMPDPVEINQLGLMPPYVDCFYRWQGYALVDLVRASDCIMPIYRTQDVVSRANGIMRIAELFQQAETDWPLGLLSAPNHWAGREKLMITMEHFRSFRHALGAAHDQDSPEFSRLAKKGARELAEHLGFDATTFAVELKERLLTLADTWMRASRQTDGRAHWTQAAWPKLRMDIQLAIVLLLALGDKSFMDYVDEWQKPHMGNSGWAPLEEVLPYEFLAHQRKFVQLASHYLRSYNAVCGKRKRLTDEKIASECRRLQRTNSAFAGFASSFFDLHEELRYSASDEEGIDFRTLRPLDHYAMVAIRAESCLREELRRLGMVDSIQPSKQSLAFYIEALANHRGMDSCITGRFMTNRKLTDLREERSDPIGRIQSLERLPCEQQHMLVQAFLCCELARNYFAHHDFLDHELLHSSKSEFLMRGIILTVLMLLDG
jgi:hypothetical protein